MMQKDSFLILQILKQRSCKNNTECRKAINDQYQKAINLIIGLSTAGFFFSMPIQK